MKRYIWVCMAAVAVIATPVWAQDVTGLVDGAAARLLTAMPQSVGMSIGIIKDGKTYTYNYGTTRLGANQVPNDHTLYAIASITKTMTGNLLAQAQLDGKLRLDDDIRLYLDGDYPNLEFEGRPIRIADLVNHRSGLPFFLPDTPETQPVPGDEPWIARVNRLEKTYSRADFYSDLHSIKLTTKPGETFKYSNAGAILAGYILERVYGQPYERLVNDRILTPLGMTDASFKPGWIQQARRARGYDGAGNEMPADAEALAAAGGLKASVADMLKYASWQLAESDPSVKLSHQAYTAPGDYTVGLNWQMLSSGGRRVIWQSGNIEGFHSFCVLEPESQIAVVAMFNQVDEKSNSAQNEMINAILAGLDPQAVLLP